MSLHFLLLLPFLLTLLSNGESAASPEPEDIMVNVSSALDIICEKGLCQISPDSNLIKKWNAIESFPDFHQTMNKIISLEMPANLIDDDFTTTEILGLAMNKFKHDQDLQQEFHHLIQAKINLLKKKGKYYPVPMLFQCQSSNFSIDVQACTTAVNKAYGECVEAKNLQQQAEGFCNISRILDQCHEVIQAEAEENCKTGNPFPVVRAIVKDFCGANNNGQNNQRMLEAAKGEKEVGEENEEVEEVKDEGVVEEAKDEGEVDEIEGEEEEGKVKRAEEEGKVKRAEEEGEDCSVQHTAFGMKSDCQIDTLIKADLLNIGRYQYQVFKEVQQPNLCELLSYLANGSTEEYICPLLKQTRDCLRNYHDEIQECDGEGEEMKKEYERMCVKPQFKAEKPGNGDANSVATGVKPWGAWTIVFCIMFLF